MLFCSLITKQQNNATKYGFFALLFCYNEAKYCYILVFYCFFTFCSVLLISSTVNQLPMTLPSFVRRSLKCQVLSKLISKSTKLKFLGVWNFLILSGSSRLWLYLCQFMYFSFMEFARKSPDSCIHAWVFLWKIVQFLLN